MLKGKKIMLGITGSIAAYKSVQLVRSLVKQGAEIKIVMTPAARDFVSPLVLETLSRNEVLSDMFAGNTWSNHVRLGRWADLMVIAPLSCNTMSKMAQGQCDNLLLSTYLSAVCPVMIAPAMDEDMWQHPATRRNLEYLTGLGHLLILPREGELASGLYGHGRMEEPEEIVTRITSFFSNDKRRDLAGRKVLVTAGPTHEAIDPVRFIGNHSSGKMGLALAKECRNRGADVVLVLGPIQIPAIPEDMTVIRVTTADEMLAACTDHFAKADITLMAAAVADFKPEFVNPEKIKKTESVPEIRLTKTPDILKQLGKLKKDGQVLLGFALETENANENAQKKLREKNADFIVLNSLKDGMAFGSDFNKITIFSRGGRVMPFDSKPKAEVAKDIIDTILSFYKTETI